MVEYQILSFRTEINDRILIIDKKREVFGSYKDSRLEQDSRCHVNTPLVLEVIID